LKTTAAAAFTKENTAKACMHVCMQREVAAVRQEAACSIWVVKSGINLHSRQLVLRQCSSVSTFSRKLMSTVNWLKYWAANAARANTAV
jgi:hypothetical protein